MVVLTGQRGIAGFGVARLGASLNDRAQLDKMLAILSQRGFAPIACGLG
jgi:hypothetical protein